MSTPAVPLPPGAPILSWAPYGRGAMTVGARTVSMSPVMSTRVSMAPVQVTRSVRGASGPAVTMAPVSMAPVTMSPVPAPPTPVAGPTRAASPIPAAPRTARPTAAPMPAAPRTARPTAAPRTHRPTQAERTAARGSRAAARGIPMPPPPPPRPTTLGAPRPVPVQSGAPFDPLAIIAIIASFLFAPVGLFLAFSSLGRARKNGVSPALSVVALLVGIVATAVMLGFGATLGSLFSGIG